MSRRVPENHDTLACLVQHAAATSHWHRTGADGRTPFQKKDGQDPSTSGCTIRGESPVAGDRQRRGSDRRRSRWCGGIFLGLFSAGQRCKRLRCWSTRRGGGTGDQARARRKCLGRGASLEREGAAMGSQATRPDDAENTVASRSSVADRASSRRSWRARRSSWPATGVHQKERRDLEEWPNIGMSRLSCNSHREYSISLLHCVTTQLDPCVLKNPKP